jgi:hypothetical protein
MRWCISIGAMTVAVAIAVAEAAAPVAGPQSSDRVPSVDVELVIAVDVSYSMDLDELAVQREGYAQAIVSLLRGLRDRGTGLVRGVDQGPRQVRGGHPYQAGS